MGEYIHHVPGRLRIKSPLIKRNEAGAAAVLRLVQALEGVTAAEVSLVTGSVIVNYDRHVLDPDAIIGALSMHGYIGSTALGEAERKDSFQLNAAKMGEAVGKAVFGVLLDKAIERSALALVGALI